MVTTSYKECAVFLMCVFQTGIGVTGIRVDSNTNDLVSFGILQAIFLSPDLNASATSLSLSDRLSSILNPLAKLLAHCVVSSSPDPVLFPSGTIIKSASRMVKLVSGILGHLYNTQQNLMDGETKGRFLMQVSDAIIGPALSALINETDQKCEGETQDLTSVGSELVQLLIDLSDLRSDSSTGIESPFAEIISIKSAESLVRVAERARIKNSEGTSLRLLVGLLRHCIPRLPIILAQHHMPQDYENSNTLVILSVRSRLVHIIAGYLSTEVEPTAHLDAPDGEWKKRELPMLITLAEELMLAEGEEQGDVADWVLDLCHAGQQTADEAAGANKVERVGQ